jgi:hypothetical protein
VGSIMLGLAVIAFVLELAKTKNEYRKKKVARENAIKFLKNASNASSLSAFHTWHGSDVPDLF